MKYVQPVVTYEYIYVWILHDVDYFISVCWIDFEYQNQMKDVPVVVVESTLPEEERGEGGRAIEEPERNTESVDISGNSTSFSSYYMYMY